MNKLRIPREIREPKSKPAVRAMIEAVSSCFKYFSSIIFNYHSGEMEMFDFTLEIFNSYKYIGCIDRDKPSAK